MEVVILLFVVIVVTEDFTMKSRLIATRNTISMSPLKGKPVPNAVAPTWSFVKKDRGVVVGDKESGGEVSPSICEVADVLSDNSCMSHWKACLSRSANCAFCSSYKALLSCPILWNGDTEAASLTHVLAKTSLT